MPAGSGVAQRGRCGVVVIVAALLAVVLGLLPLGLYFNWLGSLHRRPRPVVLGGPADLLLVLAGLAGFLPTLATLTLLALQSNARLLTRGNAALSAGVWAEERVAWLLTAGLFLAAVAGVAALALRSRRGTLAVYNVERLTLERAIAEVLTGLGLAASRFGDVWGDGREVLAIDPSPGFDYATVRLLTRDPRLREELERNLRLKLALVPGSAGRVAATLTTAGMGCLGAAGAAVALLAYFLYLTRL